MDFFIADLIFLAAGYSSLGFKDTASGSERTNLAQVRKALSRLSEN